ncbi:hypothetical protein K1719_023266 [Acacia pycnantha]|nr:hypothetical protein K1719_023266 [Acacia pycnantha]
MGDGTRKKPSFKEICKSLLRKKRRDKSFGEHKASDPTTVPSHEVNDQHIGVHENRFLNKTASKRSKTPTPSTNHLSRHPSRKCITPTPFSRNASIRTSSNSDIGASTLSRIMSRRRASGSTTTSTTASDSPSGQMMNSKCISEPQTPKLRSTSNGRSTTPIIFSQSIVRRKPSPVEMKLECSLEDLCFGSVKKIKITKDVIKHPGIIVQEEETLKIEDHPLFTRDGQNLEVRVEIPLVNALTGCSLQVPLIEEGETMTVSFEDTVIFPGFQKVIEGKGMPNLKQQDGRRGDLLIKFLINFPTELSDEQKEEAVSYLKDCSYE